jgi:SagB-type dehydrogenase family enzyme
VSVGLVLSWRDGVSAAAADDGSFAVQGPGGRVALRPIDPVLLEALRRFDPPGEREDRLVELVRTDGTGALARWYYLLEQLQRRGLIGYGADADGTRLATLVPASTRFVSRPVQLRSSRRYTLSPFTHLRRSAGESVLESPLAHAQVILHDSRAAAVVGALAISATAEELCGVVGGLSADAVAGLLAMLWRADMLRDTAEVAGEHPVMQTWEFHDLLFHARTRTDRFDAPRGATCRLAGTVAPPPALKPVPAGERQTLYRPDLAQLERDDPPMAWVQERRRSAREFNAEHPITAHQLGEFLFRVCRVKDHWQAQIDTDCGAVRMEFASRPYPAGGALYELELYAAVNICADLKSGLYFYDPSGHALVRCCNRTPQVTGLLCDAALSMGIADGNLQVLLILAARFARVAWKYESIAYALTLKHVGVVFQTMYLAATAMGLGGCAVGSGDAELFAQAAGTDHRAEASVGEFVVGSQRPGAIGPQALVR